VGLRQSLTDEQRLVASERAAALNREADRMSALLKETQDFFNSLKFGVVARVELPNGKTLAYGRVEHHGWCLHIEDSQTPIMKASRVDRIVAAAHLEAMLYALISAADREIASIVQATQTLDTFVQAIAESKL
jgi:hypothetical protein